MLPRVAIVGRPNVGKSTLFNRLSGRKRALVDDRPGVTRDWREAEADLFGLRFVVIDTAGLEDADAATLEGRTRALTGNVAGAADAILFVVDGRAGLTPLDRHFADVLRKFGKPIVLVANKCEGKKGEAGALEAFRLGFGDPVLVSAEHGLGMGDLADALAPFLAPRDDAVSDAPVGTPLRLAIVGRPNVGKSTLANRLLGEERLLTGPEPGVTRDAVPVAWVWQGREVMLVDTAGLRRKSRIHERIESLSAADTLRAIDLAEVVVLVLDAENAPEKQDLDIARHVVEEGRALVIAVNKWDAVEDPQPRRREISDRLARSLTQVAGVPVVTVSALTGRGTDGLMPRVFETYERWNARVPTASLNRWLQSAVERHAPPAPGGKRIKIRYMTQVKSRPPTFALFANRPDDVPVDYRRYLENDLRQAFALMGIPVRLDFRKGDNPYAPTGRPGRPRDRDGGRGGAHAGRRGYGRR